MTGRARASLVALVVLGATLVATALGASSALAVGVTEHNVGLNAGSLPNSITLGADGNLWFTDQGCTNVGVCAVGKINPSSYAVTESTLLATPHGIASGPDGALWFTQTSPDSIGRTTTGGAMSSYAIASGLDGGAITNGGITTGSDGNLWFTDTGSPPEIGQITLGGAIDEFGEGLDPSTSPLDITTGSDGNLWFTDDGSPAAIGTMTTKGRAIEYTTGLPTGSSPQHLILGPDHNIWFTDDGTTPAIGKITPAGAITEYTAGLKSGAKPGGLAIGVDGNIWFTDNGTTKAIGEITTAGAITEYSNILPAGSTPTGIAEGPDGDLWYTDPGVHSIGQVLPQLLPAVTTGAASGIINTAATVSGTVNPLGDPVRFITVQYGTTSAYGATVNATPYTLASGPSPVSVSAVPNGLIPGTTYHYRLIAHNDYGTTDGADQTFTTTGHAPCPKGEVGTEPNCILKPHMKVKVSHLRWRESGKPSKHLAPIGTTFSFTLTTPATVKFGFNQQLPGRKVSGKCVAATKSNVHAKACTRLVGRGSFNVAGKQGTKKVTFKGRISKHNLLKTGIYVASLTASNRAGHTTTQTFSFKIVP